jgi:hypothetical protein
MKVEKYICKFDNSSNIGIPRYWAEYWYYINNGIWYYHRDDGPAYIEYDGDNSMISQSWHKHGKMHRLEGPAYIHYKPTECKAYYLFGKRITEEQFYTPGFIDAFILENS